jgi:hypothetical protein
MKINERHFAAFRELMDSDLQSQGMLGQSALQYFTDKLAGLGEAPGDLAREPMDRAALRQQCMDASTDPLAGYLAVMAWGGQGKLNRSHAVNPWKQRAAIAAQLLALRARSHTRQSAYRVFCEAPDIHGLGPSYYTKLIYFFAHTPPGQECYIMDQFSACSVNLLFDESIVLLMDQKSPSRANTCAHYDAFCQGIDAIGAALGGRYTGAEIEMAMFARNASGIRPWRHYLKAYKHRILNK